MLISCRTCAISGRLLHEARSKMSGFKAADIWLLSTRLMFQPLACRGCAICSHRHDSIDQHSTRSVAPQTHQQLLAAMAIHEPALVRTVSTRSYVDIPLHSRTRLPSKLHCGGFQLCK